DPVIPLYLGADLLSNTDIRVENHPRYHAKFAKKGLATKVHFSSFRFQGLRVPAANNSLWFYSIQGLFRLAFEIYNKQEQLAVLENFQLETMLLLLESIDRYMNGSLDEKDATEAALALLNAEDWTKDSVYSSYMLTYIGRWIGQQFHAANSSISQKVESFKVQHIEQISDLPPAEELAAELFPEAMQTLLLQWMGLCDESTEGKRRSEYPILLLILEFANHNLITGVAHVLYSTLICK
uniref:Si:ch211-110p13.9 n=1 Tax=Poecilia reticulata TaxID=8081 RepID=A0A3P9QAE7_POERE